MKPSALTNKNKKEIYSVLGVLEDYINQGAVVIVEWATLVEDIFDEPPIKIFISKS